MSPREEVLARLKRDRPRSWLLRGSAWALLGLGVFSWMLRGFGATNLLTERRLDNLKNFLHELVPYPLQSQDFNWSVLFGWLSEFMRVRGWEASITTLAISIAAIFLAGCGGAVLSVLAARTLSNPSPYLPPTRPPAPALRIFWDVVSGGCRFFMIFVRAIPEYIWAFLFLASLGPISWPLVAALAVHNSGILGRLGAEVVENTESPTLAGLRALGASRSQLIFLAIFPMAFSRFLLFFLYRWETCVREATILGMLGISSLGFWIQDARARNHYDEMFLLILLGAALVLIGDLLSALAREWVRRQS